RSTPSPHWSKGSATTWRSAPAPYSPPIRFATASEPVPVSSLPPDTDTEVIQTALGMGLTPYPGAATPTEAFAAIKAGATKVKLFPSSAVGISGMKAWSEVLPDGTELFPVGGVGSDNAAEWRSAGAASPGLGSSRSAERRA